jgi:hypothetical protein
MPMRTVKKTALAALLGTALLATPGMAHAHGWGGWGPRPFHYGHFYGPGPFIGLGIASAVIGTAAVVDSIVRPRVYVAAPPPPYYPYYDDAYRRGYDQGRRDGYYDDGYRR